MSVTHRATGAFIAVSALFLAWGFITGETATRQRRRSIERLIRTPQRDKIA